MACDDHFARFIVALQVGREAAFVAHAGGVLLCLEDLPQRMKGLGASRAAPRRRSAAPTGMTMNSWKSTLLSACLPPFRMFIIGTGRRRAPGAAQVGIERKVAPSRRNPRHSHRDTEDGIGAELPLVGRAVQRNHQAVDLGLATGSMPDELRRNHLVDVGDCLQDALAFIAALVAVAQFDRLVLARGRAGGNRCGSAYAVAEGDYDTDGRIAA